MKYFLILLVGTLMSCVKSSDLTESPIQFNMNGTQYNISCIDQAYSSTGCGLNQYQITAYSGDNFFKINMSCKDVVKAGDKFYMQDIPTNSIDGSCTFWYSGSGASYTAPKPFMIQVIDYKDHTLTAQFSGGGIIAGYIRAVRISNQ